MGGRAITLSDPEPLYDRRDTVGMLDTVVIDRRLAERCLTALRASLTARGHLAQRVPHEGLGYCGWRSESPACVEQRATIDQLAAVVEG